MIDLFFPAGDLIRRGVPRIDLHMHTDLTDGRGKLEEYVQRARELGLSAIAFTEHADDTSDWFDEFVAGKERLQALAGPVRVYLGAEVKCAHTDGRLNMAEERLRRVDFVMGVLHRYPDGRGGYLRFSDLGPEEAQEIDFRLSLALVSNPLVDVFGHPGGVYSAFFGPYDADKMRELVTTAARNGRVVELNSAPRYKHVFPIILDRCLELDCPVSMGSDAHEVGHLGHVIGHLEEAIALR